MTFLPRVTWKAAAPTASDIILGAFPRHLAERKSLLFHFGAEPGWDCQYFFA
jgi:hypothetical protein